MRLIFIHGFLERPDIFKKIMPALPGEKIQVDVWEILREKSRPDLNVLDFAKEVAEKFKITNEDVIIGHSNGGWIAYHIKFHVPDCRVIQISSLTNTNRIPAPTKNIKIIAPAILFGLRLLYIFRGFKSFFLRINYKNAPKDLYAQVLDDITVKENHETIVQQLRIIFEPVEKIPVVPDLRLHAKRDTIVRPPKEKYTEIPGDHFTVYTQPETVIAPILKFLNQVQ